MERLEHLDNLVSLGEGVFGYGSHYTGCISLKSIGDMPKLESMEQKCFVSCTALETVGDLSSLKEIPYRAFDGCTSLVSAGDLSNVTAIRQYGFSGCTNWPQFRIWAVWKVSSICLLRMRVACIVGQSSQANEFWLPVFR